MKTLLILIIGIALGAAGMKYGKEFLPSSRPQEKASGVLQLRDIEIGKIGLADNNEISVSIHESERGGSRPNRSLLIGVTSYGSYDAATVQLSDVDALRQTLVRIKAAPVTKITASYVLGDGLRFNTSTDPEPRIAAGRAALQISVQAITRLDALIAQAAEKAAQ